MPSLYSSLDLAPKDEFADLAEEEASLGNKADSDLREQASYYHLQYCSGRAISFIEWQPQTKGVVAVSCAQVGRRLRARGGRAASIHQPEYRDPRRLPPSLRRSPPQRRPFEHPLPPALPTLDPS